MRLFPEFIAHPVNSEDVMRVQRVVAQLAPQVFDVGVDTAVHPGEGYAKEVVKDLGAGKGLPGMPRQGDKNIKFEARQVDLVEAA